MKVKKFLKGFMVAALAVTMAVTPVSAIKAAPETMPDGTIFDAEYYAQTYPDVANAVGTDRDALYNHYVTFGKAEGRMACAPTTVQTDQNPIVPSIQSKDPLTAKTTPTQALVYAGLLPGFMLTDSRPVSSSWAHYDYLHPRTKEGDPTVGTSKFEYDVYGNLINKNLQNCVIDTDGRIVACNDVGWGKYLNCVYNEQGQIIQLKHDGREIRLNYDDRGRLIQIIETISLNTTEDIFAYNEQERTITITRNLKFGKSGEEIKVIEYTYDEQGRLIKILENNLYMSSLSSCTHEYDASGKLVRKIEIERCDGSKIRSKQDTKTITEYSYN